MEIKKIETEIVESIKAKYPKAYSLEDRYISLTRQVAGLGEQIQYKSGAVNKLTTHGPIQHQLAGILVDIFMLSDALGADLEQEMLDALEYFKTGKNKYSEK